MGFLPGFWGFVVFPLFVVLCCFIVFRFFLSFFVWFLHLFFFSFQSVLLVHLVSTVNHVVIHVSIEYVIDLTESVHMVALRVLKEIVVIYQVHKC